MYEVGLSVLLGLLVMGAFLGAFFTAVAMSAIHDRRLIDRLNHIIQLLVAIEDEDDDGNYVKMVEWLRSMKKVLFSEHDLINERLIMLLERTKPTEQNSMTGTSDEVILHNTSRQLAINTLKNILVIDMGDDASTLGTIKMLVKEAIKSINVMDKEIDTSA
jgi:hypothetical protein